MRAARPPLRLLCARVHETSVRPLRVEDTVTGGASTSASISPPALTASAVVSPPLTWTTSTLLAARMIRFFGLRITIKVCAIDAIPQKLRARMAVLEIR